MSLFRWSRTAASNATADGSINWAEGMAPSAVNDSARATMAAVAKYRDDISGALVTAGTSTAYTLSSYQTFDTLAHMDGAMIAFTPHATNGATVTLNVDGLGAKPIRSAPSTELPSNSLIVGTPYVVTYYNSTSEWILQGGASNPYNIPLGAGLDYWLLTAPNSAFAFPYGQAISRVTYAPLFALMGTTYGSGDGSTTFNLPDKRGRISAAMDNIGGSTSAGRLNSISSTLPGIGGGTQNFVLTASQMPINCPWGVSAGPVSVAGSADLQGSHSHTGTTDSGGPSNHTHNWLAPSSRTVGIQNGGGAATNNLWQGATGEATNAENSSLNHTHTFTTSTATGHTHNVTATGSVSVGMQVNSGGGNALDKLPPLITCSYIMRIA